MLLNKNRAAELMERDGLDVLVAGSQRGWWLYRRRPPCRD